MAAPTNSLIQECSTCGALLDVSGEAPFALMHCPTCGAAMRVRRKFDHFEIQEELGAGGMGTVYRALDLTLNRPVALKLLHREHSANPEFVVQFQKEAAITASINHPHVVKVYSTGQDHGLLYIAMELVDKGSLEKRMEEDEKLPEVQILSVGIQIAQGLQAALDRGLIHRDIKPGNILFADPLTAKIVDFGLAVLQEHTSHVSGEVWATPFYVAPETLDGKPEDFRSDMYSLGAALFHALAGRPPHQVETNSMKALAAAKKAPVNLAKVAPGVSSATAFALDKVLKNDPAKRQQSYQEFIEHLEFARAGLLGILSEEEKAKQPSAPKPWSPGLVTTVTAAITVALGVAAFEVREQATTRHQVAEPTPEPIAVVKPPEAMTYEKARQLLAGGDVAKAGQAFQTLEAAADTPQPEKNWTTLHAALAEFLNGHADQATQLLKQLEDRGPFSPDPAEKELAGFFVEIGSKAAGASPIPEATTKDGNRENYEALALLVYGLKDWSLGSYDDAGALFRQYTQINPGARFAWVGDYKSLVSPYLAELSAFHAAMDAAKAAGTMAARKSALQLVKETKGKIKLAAGYAAPLEQAAQDLQQKITTEEEENARRVAAMEAADAKTLAEAKARIAPPLQQFRPTEALPIMTALQVTGEKAQHERDGWVKKLTWLARFKSTLINDLSTVGYAPAVQKRTGAPMPGPIRRANENGIETVTPFGSLIAQWTELSPDSIMAMAKSFIRTDQPAETMAERQWLLGVYAYFAGKSKDSQDLLLQASQAAEGHRDDLNLFLESTTAQ
jgi:tetratricopeptide (TPR) repeat protein